MASIPERENNNPSGMFKRINAAAITYTRRRDATWT
jgi:hypothetical protein